ncbi:hypothetical protein AKJ16_DCAP24435 [Drosera capensis]
MAEIEQWKAKIQELVDPFQQQIQQKIQNIPDIQLYTAVAIIFMTNILQDGSSHQGTVTSMKSNEGCFVLHSELNKKVKFRPVRIVDLPGIRVFVLSLMIFCLNLLALFSWATHWSSYQLVVRLLSNALLPSMRL